MAFLAQYVKVCQSFLMSILFYQVIFPVFCVQVLSSRIPQFNNVNRVYDDLKLG